ncbi:hypothetical protein J6590_015245 [Homalodisca vitripennis]|nr:hypothetical protein J6590_015245 [Homalodisca vitripennis]
MHGQTLEEVRTKRAHSSLTGACRWQVTTLRPLLRVELSERDETWIAGAVILV